MFDAPKRFVYVLESTVTPGRHYVGLTANVARRVEAHNAGLSPHTRKHRPWRLLAVIEFSEPDRAATFERFLKTGSGRAFARRHF
jgi:predicted GIY-YIG superfamily endonuclease